MKTFIKDNWKGFILGVSFMVCLTIITTVSTVAATGKLQTIQVAIGGIKIYVDEKLVKPTDPNGKIVEPIIYNGTTYLPLRAISNALTNNEKPVTWDGKTSTVYIGNAPVAAQTDIAELKMYAGGGMVFRGEQAKFYILDKVQTPFNRLAYDSDYVYMLDSNYSKIKGKLVVPYRHLGLLTEGVVEFYNVDKKGNKTLIDSFQTTAGDEPMDVEVDISGVDILEIRTSPLNDDNDNNWYGYLYNVVLEGRWLAF